MSELKRKAQYSESEAKRHKGSGDVLSQLECAVCMSSPIFPPIRQCPNGHILCDACSKKPQCATCPQCRAHPTSIRCLALEKAAEGLVLSCPYAEKGCKKMCPYHEADKHASKCDFKPFACPVRFAGSCTNMLQVDAHQMFDHFTLTHGISLDGDASEDAGGVLLEYKKNHLQVIGSKRGWKERLVSADGMKFLVRALEREEVYEVFVKGLAADYQSMRFDCTLTCEQGRRQLIWKGPVHGLAHKTSANRMCVPKDWAAKSFKGECTLVVHLVIKRAPE